VGIQEDPAFRQQFQQAFYEGLLKGYEKANRNEIERSIRDRSTVPKHRISVALEAASGGNPNSVKVVNLALAI